MTEQIGKIKLDLTHYPGEDLYCDGQIEDEILDIVKNHAEVEFAKIIEEKANWPILYHLSALRENIVDWIPMDKNAKVLEVGSGCGAITGALARKAAQVTCVDLSKKRSTINAYRHSECENVTIHVGNFKDIEPDLPCNYDYICLIGVFEYGQSYMGTDKPFEEFLNIIMKHLAPGGRVVIAIENKYGLKYFAGCREDHLGTYFSGIENYADGGYVRTFSRRGLEKIFAACGVKKYSFYYPYPDYKFMTTVYSDAYQPGKGELSDNLRNFDRDRLLLFDEKNAFDGIVEDNLFSVFANSYEVIIGDGFDVKYSKFSNDRSGEYCIRTEICRDANGNTTVKKHPLSEEAKDHVRGMEVAYRNLLKRYEGSELQINKCTLHEEKDCVYAEFEYVDGRPLSELLDECLEKDDMDGFFRLFKEYVDKTGYHQEYPVADFDLIFANIIVSEDKWTVIDYEWTFGKAVQAKELAFRAIYCYLMENEKRNKLNLDLIMQELGITREDAENYREQEHDFQKFVTGKQLAMGEMRNRIGHPVIDAVKGADKFRENQMVRRLQIYEDRGEGFKEEHSYLVPEAYQTEDIAEAEIKVDGNVSHLRLDPAFDCCVVHVEELLFNGKAVPMGNRMIFSTNGKRLRSTNSFVFATKDPCFCIRVSQLDRQAENIVYVRMQVTVIPEYIAENMASAVKKLI